MHPDEFLHVIRLLGGYKDFWTGAAYLKPLVLEFGYWAVVAVVTALLLWLRPRWLDRADAAMKALARRRMRSVAAVGMLALILRLAILPLVPIPTPVVHDEYSYLLQAHTFASGRLTNPPHPMWEHFETFHVNMRPTYQSMYPPGQALFLALGERLTGQPWWGVWLSVGLMCFAVTWMLQGWMAPPWALLGGIFLALRFATFSYWINSYWGGAEAAIGGALVLGAAPRLIHKPGPRNAVLLAAGLLVLANTRPFEGFVCATPVMLWLLVCSLRARMWNAEFLRRVVAPAAAVLAVGVAAMLYYNWRGTGNPLLMPYVINERTYHISRPFLWQARNPIPQYRHPVMRVFYSFHELPQYLKSRQWWGLQSITETKLKVYYEFFVWPLLLLMLPALLRMLRSPRMRLFPVTALLMLGALLSEAWVPHGHYAAPALCVLLAITLYGLRRLNACRATGLPLGPMACRALILVLFCWSLFPLGERLANPYLIADNDPEYPRPTAPELDRVRLLRQLQRLPGQHLVIVHNHLSYTGADDWIYNEPDIDHAKVVWARDMGYEKNQELLDYFRDRRIWMVDQNDGIMRLNAYNEHSGEDRLALATRATSPGKPN